jgi:hypothetical protein
MRMNKWLAIIGVAIVALAALGYLFGPDLWDRYDKTSFHWERSAPADAEAVFSGDALVLVTKKEHPNLPILASVNFDTRALTPLIDLTSDGAGVYSARLAPSKTRIMAGMLDGTGFARVMVTDAAGHLVPGPATDEGDTNAFRQSADWSPAGSIVAAGLLPSGLLGSPEAGDPGKWGVYVSNLMTSALDRVVAHGFSPAFSSDGHSLFLLAAEGVAALPASERGVITVSASGTPELPQSAVVAAYPEGLKPAALILSEDRRTAVLTYQDSNRADVFMVGGDPAYFQLLRTVTTAQVPAPLEAASAYAASGDLLSVEASAAANGRPQLTLQAASSSPQTMRLPHGITRVSIAELIGGSIVPSPAEPADSN